MDDFGDVLRSRSLEETKPSTTKTDIRQEHRCTTTENKHKKLKPYLVASYNLWPGNEGGAIL